MGDLYEKWRIREFACIEKRSSKLISLRNTAFRGILMVLSVLEFVFSVPFGFVLVVYSAVNELISVLLDENRTPLQFHSEHEDLCSDDLGKVEGYEQDYDLVYSRIEASNEYRHKTDENVGSSIRMTSPFLSWGSSGEYGNLEELLAPPPPEEETKEEFDVVEGQFGQIEPEELVRETMEMFEAVKSEGKVGIESIQESVEESTSILPAVSSSVQGTVLDLERVKLLSIEEDSIDGVSRLQTINEQLENGKLKKLKKDDELGSFEMKVERTTSSTMKVNTQNVEKMNTVKDVWNATYKSMYNV